MYNNEFTVTSNKQIHLSVVMLNSHIELLINSVCQSLILHCHIHRDLLAVTKPVTVKQKSVHAKL